MKENTKPEIDRTESEVNVEAEVMQKVVFAIKEILWMARRYADGRRTFAATNFNDAYDTLRDIFDVDIEYNNIDEWVDQTLTDNGAYFPYAQDGQFDCVTGRKYLVENNFSA